MIERMLSRRTYRENLARVVARLRSGKELSKRDRDVIALVVEALMLRGRQPGAVTRGGGTTIAAGRSTRHAAPSARRRRAASASGCRGDAGPRSSRRSAAATRPWSGASCRCRSISPANDFAANAAGKCIK